MENASKALIIAGSILLAILIISLGIAIFTQMKSAVIENANLSEQEVASFNADITPYLGSSISGSQVNALIQLATSIDNKALNSGDKIKRVSIYNTSANSGNEIVKLSSTDTAITYGASRKVETGKYYKVEGTHDANGLITTIVVTPN